MKQSYILVALTAASFLSACKKDDKPAPAPTPVTTTELTANISSAQQVPANSSAATGTFAGTYDSSNRQLTYTVAYQNITVISSHLHMAAPGVVNTNVAVPLPKTGSPITGTVTLTEEQADKLLNNGMYVNIHSAAFTAGEIRGDIRKK